MHIDQARSPAIVIRPDGDTYLVTVNWTGSETHRLKKETAYETNVLNDLNLKVLRIYPGCIS